MTGPSRERTCKLQQSVVTPIHDMSCHLFSYSHVVVLKTRGTGSQSQMSAFDENTVNMFQFVQPTETLLGENPALEVFQALCRYMRDGYVETEEEKMTQLMKVHPFMDEVFL